MSDVLFWRGAQSKPFDLVRYRCSEGDNTEYELTTSGSRLPPEAGTRRSPGDTPIAPESAAHHSRGRSGSRGDGALGFGLPSWTGAPSFLRELGGTMEIALGALVFAASLAAVLFAMWLYAP